MSDVGPSARQAAGARGPVGVPSTTEKRRETTGLATNENVLLTDQSGPSPQVRKLAPGTLPRWGSRVRGSASTPGTPKVRAGTSWPNHGRTGRDSWAFGQTWTTSGMSNRAKGPRVATCATVIWP